MTGDSEGSENDAHPYLPYGDCLETARTVIAAAAAVVSATRNSDPRLDLESLQGRILQTLTRRPWASVATLADLGDVSPMAISKALTALQAKGWVERRQHPCGDHRRRSAAATEAGVQVVAELEEVRARDLAGALLYSRKPDHATLRATAPLLAALAARSARRRRYMRGELAQARWL